MSDGEEYDLNHIELIVNTKLNKPILVQDEHQINFKTVDSVRQYIKGPNNSMPICVMVDRMMESYFGHRRTCLLVHAELITMFMKLFKGWIEHFKYIINDKIREQDLNDYVDSNKKKFDMLYTNAEHDDLRSMLVNEHYDFNKTFRKHPEIEYLLSMYLFKLATRYYHVPHAYGRTISEQYIKLRNDMIIGWYRTVSEETTHQVFPEKVFVQITPIHVAISTFALDKSYTKSDLDRRLKKFIKWHSKAYKVALNEAQMLDNNSLNIENVKNEWNSALLYVKCMYKGMNKS